jgi:hypothetical protein
LYEWIAYSNSFFPFELTGISPDSFSYRNECGFDGLGVSMLASGTQDPGFLPDQSRRIFQAGKIHIMPFFGGEVK